MQRGRLAVSVGQVENHGVERFSASQRGVDEIPGVADDKRGARIVECAVRQRRHVLQDRRRHLGIEFGDDNLAHARVTQGFARRAAIPPAKHQHALGVTVRKQERMHHAFVADMRIGERSHEPAVESIGPPKCPECRQIHDLDALIGRRGGEYRARGERITGPRPKRRRARAQCGGRQVVADVPFGGHWRGNFL